MNSVSSLTAANGVLASINAARKSRTAQPRGDSLLQATLPNRGSDALFSVSRPDANREKVALYERVGKAFGLKLDDFADAGAMARAIQTKVSRMSEPALRAMEKSLGLDDLGVSMRDVLDAMIEPGGEGDRRVTQALWDKAGGRDDERKEEERKRLGLDEVGRYPGPLGAR